MRGFRTIGCAAGLATLVAVSGRAQTASYSATTDLVVIQANAYDGDGRPVGGLGADAFSVWDDGRAQRVSLFSNQDEPLTIGLVVDSSISMHAIRDRVLAATSGFLNGTHDGSDLFAIAFNEHVRPALAPDAPFTSDPGALGAALESVSGARGKTALYDAVDAAVRYAARGHRPRRGLVVISDGSDNASTRTFDAVVATIRASDVVIHTVALTDPVEPGRPDVLKRLSHETGGEFLQPSSVAQIAPMLTRLAQDLRQGYVLGFVPASPADGRHHQLKLTARARDGRRLQVRSRAGYLAAGAVVRGAL
jgi:VWFA-related protein